MGGQVLDLEIIRVHDQAIELGFSQGKEQGISQGQKSMADNLLAKGVITKQQYEEAIKAIKS